MKTPYNLPSYFHAHPIPMLVYDVDSLAIMEMNKATCKMLGYPANRLVRYSLDELLVEKKNRQLFRKWSDKSRKIKTCDFIQKKGSHVSADIIVHGLKAGKRKLALAEWHRSAEVNIIPKPFPEDDNFRQAVQRSSIVSMADIKGNITFVNENFERISGYSSSELLGKNHRIINSGHHAKIFWVEMWTTIASGKTWRGEVKNRAKDGSYYWVDTFVMPFLDSNGKVREFLSIRNDITKRKIDEEHKALITEHLRETLRFARMGTAELEITTGSLHVSTELWELLEEKDTTPRSTPLNDFLITYIDPQDLSSVYEKIEEGMSKDQNASKIVLVQFRMRTARGRILFIEAQGTFRENGTAMGILQDITLKREAQDETLKKALQIEMMLNGITDGFFALDRQLCFVLANKTFEQLTKRAAADLVGKSLISMFPEMKDTSLYNGYLQALETGKAFTTETTTYDGKQYFEVNVFPNAEGIFVYFKDITQTRAGEAENKKLALIASKTNNLVILTDAQGRITWVNEGFERVTEYKLSEAIGKKPGDILQGAETSEETKSRMSKALKRGEGFKMEVLNYSKSGKKYWLDIEVLPLRSESGELTGFMAVETDITNLKNALHEMQRSEQALQTFMDHAPMVSFIKDLDGRYTFYNSMYRDFMKEKVLRSGFTDYDLFDKDFADSCRHRDKTVTTTGETLQFEHKVKDQTFLEYKFPLRDAMNVVFALGGISINITEKLESQRTIEENEQRFRTISDNLDDGMLFQYVTDELGQIESFPYASHGVSQLFECTAEELLVDPTKLFNKVHPDDLPDVMLKSEKSRQSLEAFDHEYRMIMPTGKVKWVQTRSKPRRIANGKTVWDGLTINTTKRKKLELALQANEAKLQSIFQSMINGVVVVDVDGEFTYANQSATEILSLQPNEKEHRYYSSQTWQEIDEQGNPYPPEKLPLAIALKQGRQVKDIEHGILVPGESIKWLNVNATPLYDYNRKLIGAVASFLDITDRKNAQIELQNVYDELNAILNSSADTTFFLDKEYGIRVLNNTAAVDVETIFGKKAQIGDSILNYIPQHLKSEFESSFQQALQGEPVMFEREIEYADTLKSWSHVRFLPVLNKQGSIIGVSFNVTNINARKLAEQKFIDSQIRLQQLTNRLMLATQSAKMGIWERNIESGVIQWDAQQYKIYGVQQDTPIVHSKFLDSLVEADRDRVSKVLEKSVATNTNFDTLFRIKKQDTGEVRFIRAFGGIELSETGEQVRMIGINYDVTEQELTNQAVRESQSRLKAIFDNAINAIILADDHGNYLDGNEAACNVLGYTHSELVELNVKQVAMPESIHEDPFSEFMKKGRQAGFIDLKGKDGRVITTRYNAVANILPGLHLSILEDITDRKTAERELIKSNRLYLVTSQINQMVLHATSTEHVLYEACKIAIESGQFRMAWIGEINPEKNTVEPIMWSGHVADYFQEIPEISILDTSEGNTPTGRAARTLKTHVDNNIAIEQGVNFQRWGLPAIKRGYLSSIAIPILMNEKIVGVLTLYKSEPNFFTDKEVRLLEEVTNNISFALELIEKENDRKQKQQALVESEERFRNLFELSPLPTWVFDEESLRFLDVNNSALRHYGYTKDEFLSLMLPDIRMIDAHEVIPEQLPNIDKSGPYYGRSWKHKKKDGTIVDVEISGLPVNFDQHKAWLITVNDITERLRSQERLLDALREKDLLIKEIHHRVKNNLQLISSIIFFKITNMQASEPRDFLNNMRQRIRSVALIHERLLQTGSINRVNLSDYLGKLISDLQMSLVQQEKEIVIQSVVEPVEIGLDYAIHCGLIVNELVTNAYKHAFVEESKGFIQVCFAKEQNSCTLEVFNSGKSLPESIKPGMQGSFGMELLEIFMKQLKANVEVDRTNGTRFILHFTIEG